MKIRCVKRARLGAATMPLTSRPPVQNAGRGPGVRRFALEEGTSECGTCDHESPWRKSRPAAERSSIDALSLDHRFDGHNPGVWPPQRTSVGISAESVFAKAAIILEKESRFLAAVCIAVT